jgi:hypothetical protein
VDLITVKVGSGIAIPQTIVAYLKIACAALAKERQNLREWARKM